MGAGASRVMSEIGRNSRRNSLRELWSDRKVKAAKGIVELRSRTPAKPGGNPSTMHRGCQRQLLRFARLAQRISIC